MNTNKERRFHKRHCMIVHAYYPLGETRVQREAEVLLKHNYEVDVICLRKYGEQSGDYFKGVRIYRLPVRRHRDSNLIVYFLEYLAFFLLAMLKISSLHWQRRYNTIQVHNPPDFLIFAAWMPKLLGAKLILDLHDPMPEFYIGRFHRDAKSISVHLVCLQERLSFRFAHHVIVVGHHWQQALVKRDVAAEKISIVMNVADDTIFRAPQNRLPKVQTGGGLHLIYHGAVVHRYGLDLVLEALARLCVPDVYLTILGRGDQMERLIRMADELNIKNQVTFRWELWPAEELPKTILSADAGIVPYRNDPYTDSLIPTKLMEYAALGLPSIAARTNAISRYFDDTMVEFFKPGSVDGLARCIMKLYADRRQLAQLAHGIKKFNLLYNWTRIGAEYVALMERLST